MLLQRPANPLRHLTKRRQRKESAHIWFYFHEFKPNGSRIWRLVYGGITEHLGPTLKRHLDSKEYFWASGEVRVTIKRFKVPRWVALKYETAWIKRHQPLWNIAGREAQYKGTANERANLIGDGATLNGLIGWLAYALLLGGSLARGFIRWFVAATAVSLAVQYWIFGGPLFQK